MKVAILGPPQSGKTALAAAAAGFMPVSDGPPTVHFAVVKVPDPRLELLANVYHPKKTTPATIQLVDIPGANLADPRGREEFRRNLAEARQCELLLFVVRAFDDPSIPPYRNRVDPAADLSELRDELVFADFDIISKRVEKVEKGLKKPTKTHEAEKRELVLLIACRDALENANPVSSVATSEDDRRTLASFGLLTLKPAIAVYNVSENQAAAPDPQIPAGMADAFNVCARAEWEISQLEPADRPTFLADLGVVEPAGNRLIRRCYDALGLISFLTAGEPEVRAWTIRRGDDAVEAAGKIHSDIARGFIRAETVAYADFVEAGDMKGAKAAGKVRQEGKSYVVLDGDIINFKFNV